MLNINFKIIFCLLVCLIFNSECIYLKNRQLKSINFPETPYESGFMPGKEEVNEAYFEEWCKKFCSDIRKITEELSEDQYLEIRGKMDATELPADREILSFGRANSIKGLLLKYGIPQEKMKAISDPEPSKALGRDKFDPENRKVRFKIQRK